MKAIELLKKFYGYDNFRKGQYKIICEILRYRDVIAIMPTGAGKSICYQIPAMMLSGITIVISPLISLMKDQVDNLKDLGIDAEYINSSQSIGEIQSVLKKCEENKIKLLYISPERLENNYFIKLLKKLNISQVTIDEAHCVSMWGHDFRQSYRNIAPFIKGLERRPIVTAFTATATKEVREDIEGLLELNTPFKYLGSFDRENLKIVIYKEEDKIEFIKDYLRNNEDESAIIYCSTRKEVDRLYDELKYIGYNVGKYHGGMKDEDKIYYQEEFLQERLNTIIATNAFGMGIDKSNVRCVIHCTLPKNIETYYQEIGRAGRDGEVANCYLLYNYDDIRTLEYLIYTSVSNNRKEIEIKKLQRIIDFCETSGCYRNFILEYFGEIRNVDYCNNCSNCLNNDELRDFTREAQMILSCVYRTREKYGISVLIDILRGIRGPKVIQNKLNELTTFNIMRDYNSKFIRDLIKTLIDLGYVNLKEGTYSMLQLNNKSMKILTQGEKVICKLEEYVEERILNKELYEKLKVWRRERAFKDKIKPYIIFSDSTLIELCNNMPTNKEEFLSIRGVGEKKYERYGEEVLNLTSK